MEGVVELGYVRGLMLEKGLRAMPWLMFLHVLAFLFAAATYNFYLEFGFPLAALAGAASGLLSLPLEPATAPRAVAGASAYLHYRYSLLGPVYLVPVRVYQESRMAHSKIYVVDDVAVTGSANLTRSGLWRNLKTIIVHEDPEAEEVAGQFLEIWEGA